MSFQQASTKRHISSPPAPHLSFLMMSSARDAAPQACRARRSPPFFPISLNHHPLCRVPRRDTLQQTTSLRWHVGTHRRSCDSFSGGASGLEWAGLLLEHRTNLITPFTSNADSHALLGDRIATAGVLEAFVFLFLCYESSSVAVLMCERNRSNRLSPQHLSVDERERGIELGLNNKEWEDRGERNAHIGSLRECVLNGCHPNMHHFIKELMAFGSGAATG